MDEASFQKIAFVQVTSQKYNCCRIKRKKLQRLGKSKPIDTKLSFNDFGKNKLEINTIGTLIIWLLVNFNKKRTSLEMFTVLSDFNSIIMEIAQNNAHAPETFGLMAFITN